jgi:hypothetical protein
VASDSERTDDGPWDALEQGFFAAAPPDVAVPAPEPMRFDDLDAVAPGPAARRVDHSGRAAAWRAAAAASATAAWRRLTPAVAAASVVSRRSARRLAAHARIVTGALRARLPLLFAGFRDSSRQMRVLAAGAAALVAVTGVSAGVVASRGAGRTLPAVTPHVVAHNGTVASQTPAPPAAVAMTAPEQDPFPAPAPSSTAVAVTQATRKRKHAKSPARQAAHAKAPTTSAIRSIARPSPTR